MDTLHARSECQRCGGQVGWIGVVANLGFVALKVVVGLTAGSKACLADALHSASNIVAAFAIFVSRKLTGQPADARYTYGLGKVEFVAAGGVSVLILILTLAVVITSFKHLLYESGPAPHLSAALVAALSIVGNEALFRYMRCVGTELRSQTILANAWANRADAFSSAAVVVGVIGAQFGFRYLDPIAALVVAAAITKVCFDSMREAVYGLMDRSVSSETLLSLRKAVTSVQEVQGIKSLRARLLGDKIWVDVAIKVPAAYTMRDCERISKRVRQCITDGVEGVGKVQVEYDAVGSGEIAQSPLRS